jgi:hypothetical protein
MSAELAWSSHRHDQQQPQVAGHLGGKRQQELRPPHLPASDLVDILQQARHRSLQGGAAEQRLESVRSKR